MHPDYINLTKALKDLNSVAQKINESKRHADNINKIIEIQNLLNGSTKVKKRGKSLFIAHRTWYSHIEYG